MPVGEKELGATRRPVRRARVAVAVGVVALLAVAGTCWAPRHQAAEAVSVTGTPYLAGPHAEERGTAEQGARPIAEASARRNAGPRPAPEKVAPAVRKRLRPFRVTRGETRRARQDCPPTSVICLENELPGTPPSEWDVPGGGSSTILGYTTDISVDKGQTVEFKVDTPATDYRVDIYRVGYYSGMGARYITTVQPFAVLPQTQPACARQAETGLVDCGNWAVSASWAIPATAVSGVYLANLVREDGTPGRSQMIFVVRDDTRGADILVQTSDATWQAYNTYGGNSLYSGSPAGRAFKVSYNRPFVNRGSGLSGSLQSYFFNSEYPMIRWLEANAYDVSYTTNVDTARSGPEILEHDAFLSVGHDEYWSLSMRDNLATARDNGVNLAFFSGNEVFWKTRWENSIVDSGTPFRTMVCYKETLANRKLDPSPEWTGTWRDPRFATPPNGGFPENELTGTLFATNGTVNDPLAVPFEYGRLRLWRNTSVADLLPGQTATLPAGLLGYEWDAAPDTLFTPSGSVKYSRTTIGRLDKILLDFGSTYGAGVPTHNLVLYKHTSGARVFGAGTTQWSWGLDAVHDRPGTPADIRIQQATVNLFADMGLQPASLQPGLVPATPSTDTTPPTTTISTPTAGATVPSGTTITLRGTAADSGGGHVAGVEVSMDGTRWFQAKGLTDWQFAWTNNETGPLTIRVRAVDDSGNLQTTPATRAVTVGGPCPCNTWPESTTPALADSGDPKAVEVGVRFQASSPGLISGVRFYKGVGNTGTHIGSLWSASGQLLARATFTGESGSGWQQVNFSTPVPVTTNATYVASYHSTSGYALTRPYFGAEYSSGLLTGLASGVVVSNGLYSYSTTPTFPTSTFKTTNYWVDVVLAPSNALWDDTAEPALDTAGDAKAVVVGVKFQSTTDGLVTGVRFYKAPQNTGTHTGTLWTAGGQLLASATFTGETPSGWQQANFATPVPITANTTYVAAYHAPNGNYSITRPFFTTEYGRGSLIAPAGATVGGNGVYRYGSASSFPNNTFQFTNYWVSPLFSPATGGQSGAAARLAARTEKAAKRR
ncbi:N,N-dimethylformamidase beta subunit family domain-containing protein [Nonomuraea sp. NPDC047897]|uniref:N,N-dimethylformamidase beta subunit family domain-containing protein n=1 Tax=Nonomuraea sp. NPDC047897 TaxID=3364346 RepID=UPI003711D9AB